MLLPYFGGLVVFSYGYELYNWSRAIRLALIAGAIGLAMILVFFTIAYVVRILLGAGAAGAAGSKSSGSHSKGSEGGSGSGARSEAASWRPSFSLDMRGWGLPLHLPGSTVGEGGFGSELRGPDDAEAGSPASGTLTSSEVVADDDRREAQGSEEPGTGRPEPGEKADPGRAEEAVRKPSDSISGPAPRSLIPAPLPDRQASEHELADS